MYRCRPSWAQTQAKSHTLMSEITVNSWLVLTLQISTSNLRNSAASYFVLNWLYLGAMVLHGPHLLAVEVNRMSK